MPWQSGRCASYGAPSPLSRIRCVGRMGFIWRGQMRPPQMLLAPFLRCQSLCARQADSVFDLK